MKPTTKQVAKTNLMKVLVILGIIILPLVYSIFYLKAFWDPYNSLDQVPVAVVNLDNCAVTPQNTATAQNLETSQNTATTQCQGENLVNQLLENGTFNFQVVDEKTADAGLIDENYYAVIKIPENFTSALNSASEVDKVHPEITYAPNTKSNYLASQLIGMAVKEIKAKIQSSANQTITAALSDKLLELPAKFSQIGDGLATINNGSATLASGANSLATGANTLNEKYQAFDAGLNQVGNGMNQLNTAYTTFNNGVKKLDTTVTDITNKVNPVIDNIAAGAQKLKSYNAEFQELLVKYQQLSAQFTEKARQSIDNIIKYAEEHPEAKSDEVFKIAYNTAVYLITPQPELGGQTLFDTIVAYSNQSVQKFAELSAKLDALIAADYPGQIKSGVNQFSSSVNQLYAGSQGIAAAIATLSDGIGTLRANSTQITNALGNLALGSQNLATGADTLNSGINTAKNTVNEGAATAATETQKLAGLSDYAAEIATVNTESYGDVNTYGVFFAPYFISLSLWVGGLLILMGLYYDTDGRFKVLSRHSDNRALRLIFYNVIGIVQAILLGFILKTLLGYQVSNLWLYYGSCILISETFLAIIMFLFFTFKDVGKFLSVVFLVLQLAACGGTFPVETEPAFYQAIYPFMPMTYSVDLLRESFVSINPTSLNKDVVILVIIFIAFTTATFTVGAYKTVKKQKHLIIKPK